MPTLLVKGSQHPLDPLPGPVKDGTKTVPTPYIQCWYVQMTLVGIQNANIACQGVTAPTRPSTWTYQGWHQDCTNPLHSVLVRANDSSGYKNANIACQVTRMQCNIEGMVVHRKYSGYSAVTFRWIKFTY